MRMMRTHSRPRSASGFTLLEIMIVVAIMGVLLAAGMPSLGAYMNNSKIQASAQSLISGFQQARAEAVRRNLNVTITLTSDSIDQTTPTASATGKNWIITAPSPTDSSLSVIVGAKSSAEGSADKITVNGGVGAIIFNSLGGTNLGAPATFAFGLDGKACGGDVRCLNIIVTPGGRTQICDPAVSMTALGDSRRCIAN
jgi:type IV fimbrial biogenesis protein FimT